MSMNPRFGKNPIYNNIYKDISGQGEVSNDPFKLYNNPLMTHFDVAEHICFVKTVCGRIVPLCNILELSEKVTVDCDVGIVDIISDNQAQLYINCKTQGGTAWYGVDVSPDNYRECLGEEFYYQNYAIVKHAIILAWTKYMLQHAQ